MSERKFVEISAGTETSNHSHLLCWRSVIAGTLIASMGFVAMTALGAALGGLTGGSDGLSASTIASGASVWLILSTVVGLFCGGFFTVRCTQFRTGRVAAAHGFILASIFFALTMSAVGSVGGGAISGLSEVFAKLGRGAGLATREISGNPMVQQMVRKAVGSAKLNEDPQQVAEEVIVHLVQGDVDSLKSYLAAKTGMNESEVNQRAAQLKSDFDNAVERAKEFAARGVTKVGTAILFILLLGFSSAIVGAMVAARRNVKSPLTA